MGFISRLLGRAPARPAWQVKAERDRESLIARLAADTTGYRLSPGVPGRNEILAEVQRRRAGR